MINSDDNKKSGNSWAEVFKTAMGESTSLFILVFSGALVIFSITAHAEIKIILASLFTLFYAVINHYLAVFSKLESYRSYARGRVTFLLYVLISLLLFIGWVRLTTEVLLIDNIGSLRDFFKFQPYSFFSFWLVLLAILYVSWLSIIFYRKNKEEKQTEEKNDNRSSARNTEKLKISNMNNPNNHSNEDQNNSYIVDFSNQIRSETAEFYTINSAFVIANSLFLTAVNFLNIWQSPVASLTFLSFILLINLIWYFELLLASRWKKYWIKKARNESKNLGIQSIWQREVYFTIFKIRANQLFYVLPVLFSIFVILMTYYKHQNILVLGIIAAIWLIIAVLGSLSICENRQNK